MVKLQAMTKTFNGEGSKIRLLSTNVANKIAAGEVVERPASVVKELVENSIDAGAKRIDVEVTAGGRNLISISDDGSGMSRDDAIMSTERQATSKIKDVDDIERISTLGFRGEALASIASVSRFTVKTRTSSSNIGTEITIAGGKMLDVKDCGCPEGTTIEVRDLFFNVPARRKFLRSYQTELAHIRNTFIIQAIAHPNLAFSLKNDGDYTYHLAAAESLRDRILDVIGYEEIERMLPVDFTAGNIHVHGFAGTPNWTRTDNLGLRVFINRRPATAPFLQVAIRQAYPRLEENKRPVVYLFIDLPPTDVDVNVHPTKREVRFRHIGNVRDAVIAALSSSLSSSGIQTGVPEAGGESADENVWPSVPQHDVPKAQRENRSEAFNTDKFQPTSSVSIPWTAQPVRPAPRLQIDTTGKSSFPDPASVPYPHHKNTDETFIEAPEGAPWIRFRIIGQLASGFVLLETEDGYTVLDPAAAHERVIYEKLLSYTAQTAEASQRLLIPQTVHLSPLDANRIEKIIPVLEEMGFCIELFGKDTFKIDSMPAPISSAPCEAVLINTANALEEAGTKRGRNKWKEEIVAKAASRTAVSTAKPLSGRELMSIISQLTQCEMPYTSPSGRPTMIYTSNRELNRRFGKT